MPSICATCAVVISLLPRMTYVLGQSSNLSSCTWTSRPNEMKPTSAFSGMMANACSSDCLSDASSSSMMAVSTTNKKTGGREVCASSMYSIVVYCGITSGGRFSALIKS